MVAFNDMLYGPPEEEEIIDVGQALSRVPKCVGASPCVTPNSMLWARKRQRLIEPCEALHLMGVPPVRLGAVMDAKFTPAQLQNLAGNAFCSYNILGIQLSMMASYDWPLLRTV